MQIFSRCPVTTGSPRRPQEFKPSPCIKGISRPPQSYQETLSHFRAIKSECFLWCRCPSRPASWTTIASDSIIVETKQFYRKKNLFMYNILLVSYCLNLDLTLIGQVFCPQLAPDSSCYPQVACLPPQCVVGWAKVQSYPLYQLV